jgi:hypothetical protein
MVNERFPSSDRGATGTHDLREFVRLGDASRITAAMAVERQHVFDDVK